MSQDYIPETRFSAHAFISALGSVESEKQLDKALATLWEPNRATTSGEDRRNVEDAIARARDYIKKKNALKADE